MDEWPTLEESIKLHAASTENHYIHPLSTQHDLLIYFKWFTKNHYQLNMTC
jgi:hypothetical protein